MTIPSGVKARRVTAAPTTTTSGISAHADGVPRSWVCARETLRSAPHRHKQKFSAARVRRVTIKISPSPTETKKDQQNPRQPKTNQ